MTSTTEMVVDRAVMLRARYDITKESAKLGEVERGTRVTVHDIVDAEDMKAEKRARIVVDEGSLKGKEGWITYMYNDGITSLIEPPVGVAAYARALPDDAIQAARTAFDVFDIDGSGALSVDELREILTRPGGGAQISDHEVAEIIATFDCNGDGEIDFEEFVTMFVPGGSFIKKRERETAAPEGASGRHVGVLERMPTSNSLSKLVSTSFAKKAKETKAKFSFRKKKSAAGLLFGGTTKVKGERSVLATADQGGRKGKSNKNLKPRGGAGTPPPGTPKSAGLLSSLALSAMKKELVGLAEAASSQVSHFSSLSAVLGRKLVDKGLTLDEILRESPPGC